MTERRVPTRMVPAPAKMLEERAEIEAFIDLARAVLGTPADVKIERTCQHGHDHSLMWFEPSAQYFAPPSAN